MKKLNLAIIGQGRSGKDIHGAFYRSETNIYFNVKYVVDADAHRREVAEEIYPGCITLADYRELLEHKDIDLIVNASYSEMHYPITKELLKEGFNVLVEKPLARNRYECDELINLAKKNGVLLAAFQQSFLAPYYLKAKEYIASGVLGRITQIDVSFSGFARRWDWQTLQKKLAGGIYNTGPHPIGLALGFLGFDPNTKVAYSKLDLALTSGDSDDCAKIILDAPDKFPVDIEVNSNDAYPSSTIKIRGTKGTFICSLGNYSTTYITDGENPERPVTDTFIQNENGDPIYCSEQLIKHTEEGELDASGAFTVATAEMYNDIYFNLTEGKPMRVTAEMAREIISIIDRVHTENPLPLKYF